MAEALSIPIAVLDSRKVEGRFTQDESSRLLRLARLMDASVGLMHGNCEAASRWMRSPCQSLDGNTPISHATTEAGAKDIESLIGRLRHGVFI